jgi:hypothetical protein
METFELVAKDLYDGLTQTQRDQLLELAEDRISIDGYGRHTPEARGYYMAHIASMINRGSDAGGQLTSKSAGDISVSYSGPDGDESLKSTWYGQKVLDYQRQNRSGFGPVVGSL